MFGISFNGIGNRPTVNLASGFTRGEDEGKVVKVSDNGTVALCEDGEKFDGVIATIEKGNAIGVVALANFQGLAYSGSAPGLGRVILVGNGDGGVKLPSAGVRAYLVSGVIETNNALRFTAKDVLGLAGHDITIELKDPSGNTQALSVDVVGEAITVSLATDGSGDIISTAAQVKTAIEASGANGLITVLNEGDSTGNGVVAAIAKTALSNGVDAGEGVPVRIFSIDTENNIVWAHIG